jgi:hypothetical protein
MTSRIKPFHWEHEFADVMDKPRGGFDVIVGNPPYGNILSLPERKIIASTYGVDVNGGRKGTWNSAALFIVRSRMLLRPGGHLGFLLPNSIIRVGQFTKTRRFLLRKMKLREIVDEGSLFDGVTLEMVSIFCTADDDNGNHDVRVISRRKDCKCTNNVPWSVLNNSKLFSLYYDDFFAKILDKGNRGIITAGRGRDIPSDHVSDEKSEVFRFPYATSGRSVKRYKLDYDHIVYVDDWFKQDSILYDSFKRSFLIATKNYPYPRCFMKPKGIIHGGGAVQIKPGSKHLRPEALGLILNSSLVKYLSIRYLTNYSELTTCLNTGIMEELPIIYPNDPEPFVHLFNSLQVAYEQDVGVDFTQTRQFLDSVADSMVYALYICESSALPTLVKQATESLHVDSGPKELFCNLHTPAVKKEVNRILCRPLIKRIMSSPRMK